MPCQIGVQTAQGQSIAVACKEADAFEQNDDRWRTKYGGLKIDQARKMKDLERENARLRRVVDDRFMVCGSPEMIEDTREMLTALGYEEGNHREAAHNVIEETFVEK